MTIRLHAHALSGSCYKVKLLLGFLELEHEVETVDFYPGRAHESLDFLEINPLGRIPVLEDGPLRLRDAQAILAHLAHRYDDRGTWLPREPEAFGETMQWLMFAGNELMAASVARLHDTLGNDRDIEPVRADARRALTVLDDRLTERALLGAIWIVGDAPTIADIACFPSAALSGEGSIGHEPYPALRDWLRAFRRLDGFRTMPGIPEFA